MFRALMHRLMGGTGNVIDGSRARILVSEGARLIDVRSRAEFAAGHIDQAVNIPVSELEARLAELGPKTGTIVLYCLSGARSARVSGRLQALGYTDVYDLGPMSAW